MFYYIGTNTIPSLWFSELTALKYYIYKLISSHKSNFFLSIRLHMNNFASFQFTISTAFLSRYFSIF